VPADTGRSEVQVLPPALAGVAQLVERPAVKGTFYMFQMIPKKIFFTSGVGVHEDPLVSFELALRDAKIEKFNLVPVSSIVPPKCEVIERDAGLEELSPGQIVFCVMAKMTSREQGKYIFACVGAALSRDLKHHGYLTEYYGYWNGEDVKKKAEESARYMLRTVLKEDSIKTFSESAIARVRKATTAVAAAVFIV